ncbi:MAG TPA: hypothetical protein VHB99_12285 [Pirellulales bacterium]|nr:hypothetical protein [Pirellulales bacterium]
MAQKRNRWVGIVVGCLAIAGIVGAGVNIARQLNPHEVRAAQAPGAPQRKQQERPNPWLERQKQLLAKMPGSIEQIEGPKAKIVPVHLVWEGASGRGGVLKDIDGCLPAGPETDVVWNRGQLYLMKKKGRLQLVYSASDVNDRFRFAEAGCTCVCFDGRYVWASLSRRANLPLVIVLDPESGQTWTLGAEEGLPVEPLDADPKLPRSSHFAIGPVAPGKACLASPGGRAQLALAEFDPQSGAKFEVLALDKAVPLKADASPEAPVALVTQYGGQAFRPVAIFNLESPGDKASQRVAVSCASNFTPFGGPLLIDPVKRSVEIAKSNASGTPVNNSRILHLGDALYWVERTGGQQPKLVLVRAASPRLEEEYLFDEAPDATPVLYDDRIAFLGERCWLWQPGTRRIESLDVEAPWIYRSEVDPREPPPPRTIAGEEWGLDEVFASRHYGVLVKANKFVRPNGYVGAYQFFQFALADDPRIQSASPAADRPQLAVELPAGTAASELQAFATAGDDERPLAGLSKFVETEPDDKFRYPILAREIVRQALLIAARDQLQWTTRDETLSESVPPPDEKPAAKWVLATRFPYSGQAELTLHRVEGDGKTSAAWKERLALNADESQPLDYAALVQAAERWSRETFPELLEQGELNGEPNPTSDDADVSPAAAEWLKQMTFTAQFVVLRELHHAIRKHGESPALLGALSRAYANLGVLSEFHWNSMHKVCKARALLYAERLVARDPQSAAPLWHRAYAKALAGLFDSASADLAAAAKLAPPDDAAPRPDWLAVLEAHCRFDGDALAKAAEDNEYSQLAALLQFFQLEGLKESTAVQTLAQRQMQKNPECFRLFDAMCDCCAINTQHLATQMAPAVAARTTPRRLGRLTGLPSDAAELIKRANVREVGLTEVSNSLLKTPAEDDREEFSWRILGRMIQEVEFVQLWRRASFMRFQWAVPTDDFIAAVEDVATGHRYRALIDLCSTDAGRWQAAAETLTGRLELEELDYAQQQAFSKGLGDAWQTRWTEQYVEAERRPRLHADDVHRDLLVSIEKGGFGAPRTLSERLMRVSSGSPDAVAANVRQHHDFSGDELTAIERKFSRQPQVLKQLAQMSAEPDAYKRRLHAYIELSPDTWAFRALAGAYRREGDLDRWKATLDECLEQPEFGLEHSNLRVQIANQYMDQGEWEKARPYAAEAAESWAEWAILCAIRCYRGLGDDENEGIWRERIVERYPKAAHWLDYYVWARRTGSEKSQQLERTVEPMIAKEAPQTDAGSQHMVGLFYQLCKRPKEALTAYRKGAETRDARHACFNNLWLATVAGELKERAVRDQAIERVSKISDPAAAPFRPLTEWLKKCWQLGEGQSPDLKTAREIAAAAEGNDRVGVNCFIARALDLRGDFDDAVEFYQAATNDPAGRFGATYSLATAILRDHGIEPRKGVAKTDGEPAKSPAAQSE